MAEWKDFVEKKAQLIMPPIYKPEVYQQGAENIANGLGRAGQKFWGGIGALAGGVLGLLDNGPSMSWNWINEKRNPAGGSWIDYVRAGWNTGHENADRLAAGMLSGMFPNESTKALADQVYANDEGGDYRVKEDKAKRSMRDLSGYAGLAANYAAQTSAAGKIIPVALGWSGKGLRALSAGTKAGKVLDAATSIASKASRPAMAGYVGYDGYKQVSGANEAAEDARLKRDKVFNESGFSRFVDQAIKDPVSIPPSHWGHLMGKTHLLPEDMAKKVNDAYRVWMNSPRSRYAHVYDPMDRRYMDRNEIGKVINMWPKMSYDDRLNFQTEMIKNRNRLDKDTISVLQGLTM